MTEPFYQCDRATLYQGNCLEVMPQLETQFDAIICDLPYGTTACKWDSIIPFESLWDSYKRLIKPHGAIVLFASQPFTSMLVMSNLQWFKYEWIWDKARGVGFQIAKFRPLMQHESVCIFGKSTINYNAQKDKRLIVKKSKCYSRSDSSPLSKNDSELRIYDDLHPTSIFRFSNASQAGKTHPTQKPIALMRYLVRTYTNLGDTILDNTMGSGSTGVAAVMEGRKFVGIEQDEGYCAIAKERITDAMTEVDSMLIKPWELSEDQGTVHEQTELFGASA